MQCVKNWGAVAHWLRPQRFNHRAGWFSPKLEERMWVGEVLIITPPSMAKVPFKISTEPKGDGEILDR